ncbi:MAG: dephospho-CoA kinase, partial [Kangiella sp.]|nr:dephospho-CoA kinase [Kangiella sp.]
AFPGVVRDGAVDRALLSKEVIGNPDALKKLESIVHPLVGQVNRAFLEKAAKDGAEMVVLDIPLLFETGGRDRVDVIVVVSAPYELQRQRVLERPDMTEEKFQDILAKQVSDADKRAGADYIVESDKGLDHARDQVRAIIADLKGREGAVLKKMLGG